MDFCVEEKGIVLDCSVVRMGKDLQVCICGGDRPHIGSVAMAEYRKSLTGVGDSATVSVVNRVGHKDEVVARKFAEKMACRYRTFVCCSCGIHVDHATPDLIERLIALSDRLLAKVLETEVFGPS